MQGRATRGNLGCCVIKVIYYVVCVLDDYYDTEDPSVNLQDFIVNSMQVFFILYYNFSLN